MTSTISVFLLCVKTKSTTQFTKVIFVMQEFLKEIDIVTLTFL